jgi:hypothetical protein
MVRIWRERGEGGVGDGVTKREGKGIALNWERMKRRKRRCTLHRIRRGEEEEREKTY